MRRRLLASYLTITVVTLLLLVVPLGRTFASRERDRLLRDIEQDATVIAGLSEDALERGAPPDIAPTLAAYARDPGGRIVVVDNSGHSVADSDTESSTGTSFRNRPEIMSAIQGRRAEGRRHSTTLDADLLYVAVPVASSGVVHGAVRITYPSSTLDDRVRSVWVGLGILAAIVAAVVTFVGIGLAGLVTRPVNRLKEAARKIAAGDLSARAPTDAGAPELRELALVFNETAARQQELLEAQRDFLGDASHQLRTPLAAIRLQLENIEAVVPIDVQPAVAAVRAETARLGRISEGLLALTKAAEAPEVRPTDLGPILAERESMWSPIADDAGVHLMVASPRLWVEAAPGALEQILDNLIDNALDVAPAGSEIRVDAVATGRSVELHVTDVGPGLDAEQRHRAFDRFWRGPSAEPGGTGLDLAIVARLAAQCGGTAELRAGTGGGLDAVVVLASAPPS